MFGSTGKKLGIEVFLVLFQLLTLVGVKARESVPSFLIKILKKSENW